MDTQLPIDFTTASPINIDRMQGQCKRLYEYLSKGNTIHCFHPAKIELRIGYLNSRISDLINKNNILINKRDIEVEDVDGQKVRVVEYSMDAA